MSSTPLAAPHVQHLSRTFTAWWRLPSLTIARFILLSYLRSGWIIGDILFVWLLYALFYLEFGGDVAYFYSTANQGLSVLAILSTVVLARRALSERMYLPLARLTTRAAYVRGLMLATGFLRVPTFLLLLMLGLGYHEFQPVGLHGATIGTMLPGALGLLANTIVIATLVVALSAPIATRRILIVFFAWLVALLSSHSSIPLLVTLLSPAQLPLIAIATCFTLGTTQTLDWQAIAALLVDVGYIAGISMVAERWLARRDLILQ